MQIENIFGKDKIYENLSPKMDFYGSNKVL